MRQKFGVTGKAVATEKQRALVYGCGRDRIYTSGSAKLNGCLDVSAGSLSGSCRFYSWFDKSIDVIEVKDCRLEEVFRKSFPFSNDVVTALKIKFACSVCQQLGIADYHRHAGTSNLVLGYRLENYLGADARRIAHRDRDPRQRLTMSRIYIGRVIGKLPHVETGRLLAGESPKERVTAAIPLPAEPAHRP